MNIQMLNKTFLATACCLLPFYAHAEVLDKLPQVQDIWMHAVLGVLFAGVALRIHRAVFMLVLIYPALWFVSLLMDVHSFDVGPAIIAEAGQSYSMNAHVAALVWLLGVVGLQLPCSASHPVRVKQNEGEVLRSFKK